MTAPGTERTCQLQLSMSGYRGEADSVRACRYVCIDPEQTCVASNYAELLTRKKFRSNYNQMVLDWAS